MHPLRRLGIVTLLLLQFPLLMPVHASTYSPTTPNTCSADNYCIYKDPTLQSSIGSLTAIPRFYHMAEQCYLQAAMLTTIRYYNASIKPGGDKKPFTPAETGVQDTWQLDSFCTKPLKSGDTVINEHVMRNTAMLYNPTSNSSALYNVLANYDKLMIEDPDAVLSSTNMRTPERVVSDVLWSEFFAYSNYLSGVSRTPDDYNRATAWAASPGTSRTSGTGVWTSLLTRQIEMLARLDASADLRVATATRYVADIMYGEFAREYPEHLQYILMRDNVKGISTNMDRIERALATLGLKLPDAYVTGN